MFCVPISVKEQFKELHQNKSSVHKNILSSECTCCEYARNKTSRLPCNKPIFTC